MGNRKTRDRKRGQQRILYRMQHGLCYWCGIKMIFPTGEDIGRLPDNYGTIDHLDDKWSGVRGQFSGERRRVMACNKCNNERSSHNQRMAGTDALRERSSHEKA